MQVWGPKALELVAWWKKARERMPAAPFDLYDGHRVVDAGLWKKAIDSDVEGGPGTGRGWTGSLQADLARLRALMEGGVWTQWIDEKAK